MRVPLLLKKTSWKDKYINIVSHRYEMLKIWTESQLITIISKKLFLFFFGSGPILFSWQYSQATQFSLICLFSLKLFQPFDC